MDNNKVTVRIMGQEYTIVGDTSKDTMLQVASYVDEVIGNVHSQCKKGTTSSVAILSAVNITQELFECKNEVVKAKFEIANVEQRAQRFKQLWEEAKNNYDSYKDENTKMMDQNQALVTQLKEARQIAEQALAENIKSELSEEVYDEVNAIKEKYKDLESSFFDLQMENIKLKSELDKSKVEEK